MGFIRDHSGNKYTTRNKILKGKTQQKTSIDFSFFFPPHVMRGEKAHSYDALKGLVELHMIN